MEKQTMQIAVWPSGSLLESTDDPIMAVTVEISLQTNIMEHDETVTKSIGAYLLSAYLRTAPLPPCDITINTEENQYKYTYYKKKLTKL